MSRPSRAFELGFWVTALGAALPLLVVRHAPFTDLPEHVAAIATIARLLPGGGGSRFFEVSLGQSQYLVYHTAGAVLARALGDATLANRVLLAAFAVLWPVSLRALLRALGRDERLAVFGCMVVWNRALAIGFLPYFASIPVANFALAAFVRHLDAPRPRSGALAGALALLLFYTHVSSYVLFGATAAAWCALRAAGPAVGGLRARARLALAAGAPLAPSAAASLVWLHAGSLATNGVEHVGRLPVSVAVHAMPVWCFDVWRSHVDELCAIAWWLAFAALTLAGLSRKPDARALRATLFALVPCGVTTLVYLVTPFHLGAAGYLDVRLAPMIALFALAGLDVPRGAAGRLPLALAAAGALVMAADATFEMRRMEAEVLGDGFDRLLATMRPGASVVTLDLESRSPRAYFWPYVFAGSYHRVQADAIASYSFSELAHWPVHYRPGVAPPSRVPFSIYAPCTYRYREDGERYDYVLVQGAADPFSDHAPGPTFEPVARSGKFTLFAKTAAETEASAGEPDRGPCALVPPPTAAP
jgi:hypothetical protein